MNIDEAKNLAYILDRREHTAAILVQTNPPVQGDNEPKLKVGDTYRVYKEPVYNPIMTDDCFEKAFAGEALPLECDLVIYTEGEVPIQNRAEEMPKQGFNGA